ncbi:MAG: two-component system sensor histidine kinase NtrB [Desulfitobacteriaceae bacterium]
MFAKFRNYFNRQSIIQFTLIKITATIFGFLIVLLFLYGQNYWKKEGYRINYELLSVATAEQSNIQSQINKIELLKQDITLTKNQIEVSIAPLVMAAVRHDDNTAVGYYDLDLDTVFIEDQPHVNSVFEQIRPKLGSINEFQEFAWNSQRVISINLPVYQNQKLVGYVWAYSKNNISFFESYRKVSEILILTLSLSVLIVILVRKNIREIESHLDSFSKSIIDDNYDHDQILTRLPELQPVLYMIIDFTDELKHMNLELEASNRNTTKILEGISDGFFALDRSYRFTFINRETARLISRTDTKLMVLGKSLLDVFPRVANSITHDKINEALKKNEAIHWEAEGFTNSEQYYEYHAYPFKEGLTVFFRNITDLRQQQQELAHLERLNLISQLAAGISHEIRNPLTTVRGFLQFLGTKPQYTREKEYMDLMISEIDRANLIITDFLSLSKENLDNIKPRNINEIINKVYPLLQADAYNNNKQVFLSLGILPDIMLNENEIKQLVLNLVRNGLEAIPEHGSVFISTYQREDKIMLAIKDQGSGIPAEIQGRIGTPFFTTKDTGTGLGLAISIGIARRHKAEFEFETGSEGTTFYITFPVMANLSE